MQSYRDLVVWQKAIDLVLAIYLLTERFPKSETFGLTSQMRRAAVSIPANIAEGYTRKHRKEYIQFVRIAYGSGAELETYLVLVQKLNLADDAHMNKTTVLLDEIMRMLNRLNTALVAKL